MALGTTAAILLGLGAGGAGLGVSKMLSKGGQQDSSPTPLPQAPSVSDASAKAEEVVRKKRSMLSQSIYTSPLGVAGEANIARKTLLGQ